MKSYLLDFFTLRSSLITLSTIFDRHVHTSTILKIISSVSISQEPMEREVSRRWYSRYSSNQEKKSESIRVHTISISENDSRQRIDWFLSLILYCMSLGSWSIWESSPTMRDVHSSLYFTSVILAVNTPSWRWDYEDDSTRPTSSHHWSQSSRVSHMIIWSSSAIHSRRSQEKNEASSSHQYPWYSMGPIQLSRQSPENKMLKSYSQKIEKWWPISSENIRYPTLVSPMRLGYCSELHQRQSNQLSSQSTIQGGSSISGPISSSMELTTRQGWWNSGDISLSKNETGKI